MGLPERGLAIESDLWGQDQPLASDCEGQASEVKIEILLGGCSHGKLYVDVGVSVDLFGDFEGL